MAYFDEIDLDIFNLGDLSTFQSRDVTNSITSFDVSLSLDSSSQISVGVIDPDFTYARANYFQVRRDIFYRNIFFEISAVNVQRSDAVHPLYTLECRSKAVQLMKRDKKPEAYRGMTAYDFAFAIAKRFSLKFVGEKTTKKQSIVKGKSRNADESVWTVLRSLASEQKFVCFESEGTLFFCSEPYLLGKWGDPKCTYGDFKFIPFFYPYATDEFFKEFNDKYILLEMPQVRRSDDDIKAADGTLLVDRFNGVNLRPGMTIFLGGIPDFEAFYIITNVQFKEGSPEPVRVSFRLPVDPSKEKISTSTSSSSSNNGGNTSNNSISAPTEDRTVNQNASLTPTNARAFTLRALSYLKYRGRNAAFIQQMVALAVDAVIRRPGEPNNTFEKRVSTFSKEIEKIRKKSGVSEQDRELAEICFVWYLSGKNVQTLGASGGVSREAISQVSDSVRRNVDSKNADALSQPSGTTSSNRATSGTTSAILTANTPAPQLPSSVSSAITNYINRYAPRNTAKPDKTKAINDAIATATAIYRAPTSTKKLSIIQDYYRSSSRSGRGFTLSKAKYNAIRQGSVIAIIYPTTLSFSLNQVPVPWLTTQR